jgi:predicted transposase/invertase (TIGR01784 family)
VIIIAEKNKEKIDIDEVMVPTNDYIFKRIFGYEGNEKITQDLVSCIIPDKIESLSLNENRELERDLMNDKLGILDIKLRINGEIPTDLEMQIADQGNIVKRMLYYWSLMYSREIRKGEDYDILKRTIVILFTNFDLEKLKEIPEFHTQWSLRQVTNIAKYLPKLVKCVILEEVYIIYVLSFLCSIV